MNLLNTVYFVVMNHFAWFVVGIPLTFALLYVRFIKSRWGKSAVVEQPLLAAAGFLVVSIATALVVLGPVVVLAGSADRPTLLVSNRTGEARLVPAGTVTLHAPHWTSRFLTPQQVTVSRPTTDGTLEVLATWSLVRDDAAGGPVEDPLIDYEGRAALLSVTGLAATSTAEPTSAIEERAIAALEMAGAFRPKVAVRRFIEPWQ